MGRRVATGPGVSTPEAAAAYAKWREDSENRFRVIWGYTDETAIARRADWLLVSHVAWDRGPGLVTQHALAAGLVDLDRLEQHRAALREAT